MDYLQYLQARHLDDSNALCFKPYYKWITFNIRCYTRGGVRSSSEVLNLIINGLPSIL